MSAGDVPIRDAATVALLRDGTDGVEAWMLTRVTGMTFAAGMSVFPGGRIEASDADLPISGDPAVLAARFDCDDAGARALIGGAARETFEETGVLLGSPAADLREHRAAVEAGTESFGELLRAHGVTLDASLLAPWARWVTPAGEPRRYDTRFFVAALPEGAQAADVTTESSAASWLPIAQALAEGRSGARRLMPPTAITLGSLLPFATVAEAFAASAGRDLTPVRPTLRVEGDTVTVTLPSGETVDMPLPR